MSTHYFLAATKSGVNPFEVCSACQGLLFSQARPAQSLHDLKSMQCTEESCFYNLQWTSDASTTKTRVHSHFYFYRLSKTDFLDSGATGCSSG